MSKETVKALLSLCLVVPYAIVMLFLGIAPVAGLTDLEPKAAFDFSSKFVGLYSGIVGMIVGYYFGAQAKGPRTDAPSSS